MNPEAVPVSKYSLIVEIYGLDIQKFHEVKVPFFPPKNH